MKANQEQIMRLLKTAKGQMEGIIKMVEDDRYCVDISNQIMATDAILRKANREILRAHMKCCVREAVAEGREEAKIDELIDMIDRIK